MAPAAVPVADQFFTRAHRAQEPTMLNKMLRLAGVAAFVAASAVAVSPAYAQADQQKLVADAETAMTNFLKDPEMKWLQQNLHRAKAVLIAPEVAKAGFIIGGSGGRAVLVAKDAKSGKWVGPAFYTLVTGSVGFQAGISVSEMVTLVMTDKGFNSLLASTFKMGADASVAAGPVGAGAKSDIVADLIAFSRSKGVYGGINLDGTAVSSNTEWDTAYYGKKVLPPDILVRMNVSNKGADKLLGILAGAK
jgi:lipid-binding SYLF domain-containing protein